MSNNPLSNLGWEMIIEFLEQHGCERGEVQGDDVIYYYPQNRTFGICISMHPKKRRSGYSTITLLDNIRTLTQMSGGRINKQIWRDWFREKRNF